jgi:ATP phosphoribosyltransferase regulatory subunit
MELLALLIAAVETLDLGAGHQPQLLIGHTALMDLVLSPYQGDRKDAIRTALTRYDRLAIEAMDLPQVDRARLLLHLDSRGRPDLQLRELEKRFGPQPVFSDLKRLTDLLTPAADAQGVSVQLDATFQPIFELYTGLVFQLVCQGKAAPVVIARGGRYDDLVRRCGAKETDAAGVGFSLAIDPIRELLSESSTGQPDETAVLVAYSSESGLEDALQRQLFWHQQGTRAVVELKPVEDRSQAEAMARERGGLQLDWITL